MSDGSRDQTAWHSEAVEELLEAVPDALVGVDGSGMIRFVSRQTESLFGYERDDLVGLPVEVLVPEFLRSNHRMHRESYISDPRPRGMGARLKLRGQRRDGTQFPADIALSPMHTRAGMLVIAAVRDMTHYWAAEAAHRRQALLAAVVEHSAEVIISSTPDGIITSWNPAAEKLLGYSSREILDKSVELLSPEDRPGEMTDILARILHGEQVVHCETVRVRRDGTVFPASLTVSPIRDVDGKVIGASTIAHDLTKQ
ncbi:MAG: PAS domain S-box protein [Actinomycetota bacterium]